MKKVLIQTTILILFVVGGVAPGFAHIISIEGETLYSIPKFAPDDGDFSFAYPFSVTRFVQDPTEADIYVGPEESQAVFAYLTRGDFDVYKVVVRPEDFQIDPEQGLLPLIISASALSPACRQTRNNYPITALLYPLAPDMEAPPLPDLELPFEMPAGYGITVAENPRVHRGEQRPIFNIDLADPELELGIAWFLPLGLTQECLLYAPFQCNFENTVSQPIFSPGVYYIVIWDPHGRSQDYTANIGFLEEVSVVIDQSEMQETVKDNALLHRRCSDPYPWTRW